LSTKWGMEYKKWVAAAIVAASVFAGVFFWQGWLSILPVLGVLIYTLAEAQECDKRLRYIAFLPASAWLIFNIITGSYGGVIANLSAISSNLLGLYRHHFRKVKKT